MVVSMLSDDMLERQAGVCIFSFIYTLFVTQTKENHLFSFEQNPK